MTRKVPYRCFGDVGDEVCVPSKYVRGLSAGVAEERAREIRRRADEGINTPDPLPGDDFPTRPSSWTRLYKQVYGDDAGGSVDDVAEETGIDFDILDEVYSRGVGAARTSGRRPGTTDYSWALARVYAFVMKAQHGYAPLNHDQDLAREAGLEGRRDNPVTTMTYEDLLEDLAELSPGIVGAALASGTWKTCGTTAQAAGQWLRERGYTVYMDSAGRSHHFALRVETSDGPYIVDPTHAQYLDFGDPDADEYDEPGSPLMDFFVRALEDPLEVYEIHPAVGDPHPRNRITEYDRSFLDLHRADSYQDYWEKQARRTARAVTGKFSRADRYLVKSLHEALQTREENPRGGSPLPYLLGGLGALFLLGGKRRRQSVGAVNDA